MDKHKHQHYLNIQLEVENDHLREELAKKDELIKGYGIYAWLTSTALLVLFFIILVLLNG